MGIVKWGRRAPKPQPDSGACRREPKCQTKRLLFFRGFFLRGFLARRKLKGGPPLLEVVVQKGIKLPLGAVGDESLEEFAFLPVEHPNSRLAGNFGGKDST